MSSNWMCRICGCVGDDCANCVRRTGKPCAWAAENLCTACVPIANLEVEFAKVKPIAAGERCPRCLYHAPNIHGCPRCNPDQLAELLNDAHDTIKRLREDNRHLEERLAEVRRHA